MSENSRGDVTEVGPRKPRRVVFHFDERSLTDLKTLVNQGRVTAENAEMMQLMMKRVALADSLKQITR